MSKTDVTRDELRRIIIEEVAKEPSAKELPGFDGRPWTDMARVTFHPLRGGARAWSVFSAYETGNDPLFPKLIERVIPRVAAKYRLKSD
jgi:hypothetical protein